MKLYKMPSITAALAATLSFVIVQTEALMPCIDCERNDQPVCPKECGVSASHLKVITDKIIKNEASLVKHSCGKRDETNPSFQFKYSFPTKKEDMEGGSNRRLQSLEESAPRYMPPIEGFNQTIFGWSIDISTETSQGACFTEPNVVAGPFPLANITSCIQQMELSCFHIQNELSRRQNEQCPCYDEAEVKRIKMKLMSRRYDPDFQVDMMLSCKNPKENNGLPYGFYTQPNGLVNGMYGSTLRVGVDMMVSLTEEADNINKCYYTDNDEAPTLTISQHSKCTSLMEDLCSFVETIFRPPPPLKPPTIPKPPSTSPSFSSCSDNPDFRYKGEADSSCENVISKKSRWIKKRTCEKYDEDTNKYVFQHCRKSCQKCSCTDSDDFYFNNIPEQDCNWVSSLEADEKEEVCHNHDVADNCKVACGSNCCKNNPKFSYWKEVEYGVDDSSNKGGKSRWTRKTCDHVSNSNWKEECQDEKVAVNCPMVCRKCFIQPRI